MVGVTWWNMHDIWSIVNVAIEGLERSQRSFLHCVYQCLTWHYNLATPTREDTVPFSIATFQNRVSDSAKPRQLPIWTGSSLRPNKPVKVWYGPIREPESNIHNKYLCRDRSHNCSKWYYYVRWFFLVLSGSSTLCVLGSCVHPPRWTNM